MFVRTCAALFGVTLLCSTAPFAQSDWPTKAVKIVVGFAPGLYPKLPYDPLKDLVPVSLVADSPSMLISRVQLPVCH